MSNSIPGTMGQTSALASDGKKKQRVMIAGIGNVFLQDDGFGVLVAEKLKKDPAFKDAEIRETGTGGLKLAYDLLKGYDLLILLDAAPRGEEPGTLYVIEPREEEFSKELDENKTIDPHGTDTVTMLQFVRALGAWPGRLMIIGCEPETCEDFSVGLSNKISSSVDRAIKLVAEILEQSNRV